MRLIDADLLQTALMDEYVGIAGYNTRAQFYRAIEIVQQQPIITPPPNDPLTLEELREMGGEPYWHVGLQKDSAPPHWSILDPFFAKHIEDYWYGERWLAYRRKPEEGTT